MANGNFGGGDGKSTTPYLIEDYADLVAFSSVVGNTPSGTVYAKQVANIVSNGSHFPGIASVANIDYNGGGFTISNLRILEPMANYTNYAGFAYKCLLKNLTFVNPVYNVSASVAIGTFCSVQSFGTKNVTIKGGSANANAVNFGGIAGTSSSGSVENCRVEADIINTHTSGTVGGVINTALGSWVNLHFKGNITSNGFCAGVLAQSSNGATFRYCSSEGNISSDNSYACGLSSAGGNVVHYYDCYSKANVTAKNEAIGLGSMGGYQQNKSYMERCYASGNVTSINGDAYSLVDANGHATITSSFALSPIVKCGSGMVASDIGHNPAGKPTIVNCYRLNTMQLYEG